MSENLHFRRYFPSRQKLETGYIAIHDMRVAMSKKEPNITELIAKMEVHP